LMRGAKTLSGLAVEVFIEEERIPPDPVLLEAELASSSAIATLVVPLDVVVYNREPIFALNNRCPHMASRSIAECR
jgi:hypothetical protein